MSSRSTLEADLLHHQEAGDLAAQAETLLALAQIANAELEHILAIGLYGQAWAIYEQLGDQQRSTRTMATLADEMVVARWNTVNTLSLEFDLPDALRFYELALSSFIELKDIRGQADVYKALGTQSFYEDDIACVMLEHAFERYESLGDVEGQSAVIDALVDHQDHDDGYRLCLERALLFYQRIDNPLKIGQMHMAMAQNIYWDKDYAAARLSLEAAIPLFTDLKAYEQLITAHLLLSTIIMNSQGYEAYLHYYYAVMQELSALAVPPTSMIRMWESLPIQACRHQDFPTARYSYQQAITHAVTSGRSGEQGELYWRWGFMEFHEAQRQQMGYAICQRAVALLNHRSPTKHTHQKQLRQMLREINRLNKRIQP